MVPGPLGGEARMELMKVVPNWVVVTLVLFVAGLLGYAVATGREVSFWPRSNSISDPWWTIRSWQRNSRLLKNSLSLRERAEVRGYIKA